MNTARGISRKAWVVLGAGAVMCGAAFSWPQVARRMAPPPVPDEHTVLKTEHDSLAGNTEAVRDHLRGQRLKLTRDAWTPDGLKQLESAFGPGWRWQWDQGPRPVRAVLERADPRLEDWPALLTLVGNLEARTGLVVEHIQLAAEGPRRGRRLTRMAVGLRFLRSDAPVSDAERSGPSPGPLPVAEGFGSAASRKIGPGPSLGGPTASAKPAASGPAFASVQSRSSGVLGRVNHQP